MEIKDFNKALIFIDESTLSHNQFFDLMLSLNESKNAYHIFTDVSISHYIENLRVSGKTKAYVQSDGIISLLLDKKLLSMIETNNYFDFNGFKKEISKISDLKKVIIITQKESIYTIIKDTLKDIKQLEIVKFVNQQIEKWKTSKNQLKQAFYLSKDISESSVNPEEIDYVYSPKYGYLKLNKETIISGGEGMIFKTYNGFLCKLYHEQHQTYVNHKKLLTMLDIDINNTYINWPLDILYYNNIFVGYLIEEITDAVSLDDLRISNFPDMYPINRYEMCLNFLKNVHYLHNKNIIVGDMKLDNILVKNKTEVYLIDSGSYQVYDYPCIVYHESYTNKVYSEDELKKHLRTIEDEYYAINKILFEILIGKYPNYNADGDSDADPYGFNYPLKIPSKKTLSQDKKLWSIMSQKMREMFYYYFKENKVSYLSEWINEFEFFIEKAYKEKEKN